MEIAALYEGVGMFKSVGRIRWRALEEYDRGCGSVYTANALKRIEKYFF